MYVVDGKTIKLTRGDTLVIQLQLKLKTTGEEYTPQEGDAVRFGLKSRLNASRTSYIEREPLIEKSISIDDMLLRLDPEDTKNLPFGDYRYDIEVTFSDGKVDTVINDAPFVLLPEVV